MNTQDKIKPEIGDIEVNDIIVENQFGDLQLKV
jgi:hypothetical protein